MKKEKIKAEVAEGFESHFLNRVEAGDKVINRVINDQDLGKSAAMLASQKGIPFSEAKQIVSSYYTQ